jgi:hypothetical protein
LPDLETCLDQLFELGADLKIFRDWIHQQFPMQGIPLIIALIDENLFFLKKDLQVILY